MADLKVALLPVAAVHGGDLLLKAGHKVLEGGPVVGQSLLARLKIRGLGRRLHLVPRYPVGGLHHTVGRVRLLIEGAVIPERAAIFAGGFQDALLHSPKAGPLLHIGEGFPHLGFLHRAAGELRHIVEGGAALPGGHLVPGAAVRGSHHGIGALRCFILAGAVIVDLAGASGLGCLHGCPLFPRCRSGNGGTLLLRCLLNRYAGCGSVDMAPSDLGSRQGVVGELGHEVLQAPVGNVPGDSAGHSLRAAGHGGDGLPGEHRPVSGSDAPKCPAHKSYAAAQAHAGTALHHRVPDVGVAFELAGKSRREGTGGSTRAGGCGTGRRPTGTKHTAGAFGPASQAAEHPCRHDHLHGHAGTGLGHIQPHSCQVAVKFLGGLEKSQGAKQPEEHRAAPAGQSAAVADELAHRAVKSPEEPHVEHQQQQLGTHHPAPGFEHLVGGLGASHSEGQGAGVAQHSHHDVALHTLQQEFEVVPAQGDEQNENEDGPHNGHGGDNGRQAVFQSFLNAREGEILRLHGNLHEGRVGRPGNVQHNGEDGPGGSHQQGEQSAAQQELPGVLRLGDGAAEHPKQLPHGDEEQDCPGHVLHHLKGLGDKGEVPLHGVHVRAQGVEKHPGHRVHQFGSDTGHPGDDTFKNPIEHPSPPLAAGVLAASD